MKTYKKRAKAGWETGKYAKESSNRSERNYSKEEVRQEIREFVEGEDFRVKHRAKKILDNISKMEKQLNWYEKKLEYWTRDNIINSQRRNCMVDSLINSLRSNVERLKKKIEDVKIKRNRNLEQK